MKFSEHAWVPVGTAVVVTVFVCGLVFKAGTVLTELQFTSAHAHTRLDLQRLEYKADVAELKEFCREEVVGLRTAFENLQKFLEPNIAIIRQDTEVVRKRR